MKKFIIIILGLVWLVCAPIYVSIDHYASQAEEYATYKPYRINVWVPVYASSAWYYLIAGHEIKRAYGNVKISIWGERDEFSHLKIDSVQILVSNNTYDLDLKTKDINFLNLPHHYDGENREATFSFVFQKDVGISVPKEFQIKIIGTLIDDGDNKEAFSHTLNIIKVNKSSFVPLYKYISNQLTAT